MQRRRARVLELRGEGKTFREIAAAMGISLGLVHGDFETALREIPAKSVEAYREHQAAELNKLRAIVQDVVERRHVIVSEGRVVHDDDDEPLEDDGMVLAAIDRLMKINDREAKLFGLDARPEVQITGTLAYEVLGFGSGDKQEDGA